MPHSPPDIAARTLRFTVPNAFEAVEAARLRVHAFIAPHALAAPLIYRLELVLEEMLMNRLRHAFPEGGSHATTVVVSLEPETLALCFEDDGIPFDPLRVPVSGSRPAPDDLAPGGYGVMLTRKAASSCDYRRIEGRNRFTVRLDRS